MNNFRKFRLAITKARLAYLDEIEKQATILRQTRSIYWNWCRKILQNRVQLLEQLIAG